MEIVLIWIVSIIIGVVSTFGLVYLMKVRKHNKAKKEIFEFVKSYKWRCKGHNRFVVTIESLQDSFREYDTNLIEKIWTELVNEKIIEQDPLGGEWCIR